MKKNHLPIYFIIAIILCLTNYFVKGQPVIGDYKVYYGTLHNHTSVSDGQGTPSQAYNYARNTAHLDFFGLAEHSQMMTSSEWSTIKNAANTYNQDDVFAAFYGFEWTTFLSYGHVAVINTEDYCSNTSPTSSFKGLLSWINARNGIAFFNHPGWESTAFQEFDHFSDAPSEKFVGMELWNDHDGFSKYYYNNGYYSNDNNKGYFDEALIRSWKIGAAGSDDNHTSTWGTATDYRVGVLAKNLTRVDIMNAMLARRFFTTIDRNLFISFKINGAEMGSTIIGGTYQANIQASDLDLNEVFTEVVLLKNGVVQKTWTPNLYQPIISENISCSNGDYFYIRVKQRDGGEAISSPIFISGMTNQPPTVAVTSPANGAVLNFGQSIQISANAGDSDGSIAKVEFYQGTVKLGEVSTTPYSWSWTDAAAGGYVLTAKAFDNLGASTVSAPVSVSVTQQNQNTFQSSVASGKDDAEEYKNGTVILNNDDLDLVYDSKTTGNQTVGLLFRNLNIPKGSTVTKAYLQFTTDKITNGSCSLTIRGEASDNAADFSPVAKNLSGRTRTAASVGWIPSAWNVEGECGVYQQSPDIKSIVQEIVNRSGWTSTSKLVILITGSGTRTAKSYDNYPTNAAYIYIECTPASIKSGFVATENQVLPGNQRLSTGSITVYPNPVTDKLTIRISDEIHVDRILIYSMTGKLVNELKYINNQAETQINCSALPAGTYLLYIHGNKGIHPMQFIKQ